MPKRRKDAPLDVAIEHGQLVIRMGISTLAFAAENCPELYDDVKKPSPPYAKVTQQKKFAEDIARALCYEQEDGTTPIHVVIDQAILHAIGDGSEWIECD